MENLQFIQLGVIALNKRSPGIIIEIKGELQLGQVSACLERYP
jgi:hypothetical protein